MEEAGSSVLDPGDLWLGWEAHPPRISDEEQRREAESLVEELLSQSRSEKSLRRFRTLPVIELLLEKSASCLPRKSQRALRLAHFAQGIAALLGGPQGEVGCARALYLKGNVLRLLGRWGATRTSLVAYLLPVFGIVLGAAVLHERVDARTILGTALVIGGIALVNARSLPWRRNVAAATAEEHAA